MSFVSATQASAGHHPSFPQSPDPTLPDPSWLQDLESHPIFSETVVATNTEPLRTAPEPAVPQSAPNPHLMAVRNTDLILAVHNQIRIASLLDAKASLNNHPMSPHPSTSSPNPSLSFKVLEPTEAAHVDFDVRHLVVNPTGKLLALVGDYTVSLLVLPRSGYNKQVGAKVSSRSVPVGPYYHSRHGFSRIAKVQWHPWGEAGTSLLVLTDDGLLREYDVSRDTEEPQQCASLVPRAQASSSNAHLRNRSRSATPTAASLAASIYSSPAPYQGGGRGRGGHGHGHEPSFSPSRSRADTPGAASAFGLTADDDDSRVAVGFTLCISQAPASALTTFDDKEDEAWAASVKFSQRSDDWSAFTVLGLMKNGDVWAVCPFMPRNSMIPPSYIHALSRLTTLKLSSDGGSHDESTETELEAEMQLRFLNALLKQIGDRSGQHERSGSRARSSATPGPDRFGRHRSTSSMDLDDVLDANHDVPLRLHPPTWTFAEEFASSDGKNAPRPQGPFLLRPAPLELCEERESAACDIAWTWLDRQGRGSNGSGSSSKAEAGRIFGLGIVSIVGHDGRVDIGILLDPLEPRWGRAETRSRAAAGGVKRSSVRPARTNRYGLSDTEDEGDDSIALNLDSLTISSSVTLPTLLVYETIDLGLLDSVMESSQSKQSESSDILLDESALHRPCFVADPLYRDTLYVYHALGAQCLGFAKWTGKLIDVLNLPSEEDLETAAAAGGAPAATQHQQPTMGRDKALTKLLHHGETTEVAWIVKTVSSSAGDSMTASLSMNPVVAVCILSDVYLSYSLLAVTQDLQLVALELSLRIDADGLISRGLRDTVEHGALGGADGPASTTSNRPRAYVSLLGDGTPFTPPALFSQSGTLKGLPSQPRRATASGATSTSTELKVTPDALRQLGKTVEGFRVEIRDIVQAGNAVQARLDLQVREMTRMLEKLEAIRKRCEKVSGAGGLEGRLARIKACQDELTTRTDKALQRLMDRHQPSLSVYEKRWFDELGRIARDVGITTSSGSGGGGVKGLVAKSELLQHHLDLLRPSLQALSAQKQAADKQQQQTRDTFGQDANVSQRGIGRDQLRRVETMLGNEARLLAEAKDKVVELNARIARQGAVPGGVVAGSEGRGWGRV